MKDYKVDVSNIVIETERLLLRAWKESDLNDLYEYASVDGVGQMAGWPPHQTIEGSKYVLNMFIEDNNCFAIEHKKDHKVIGSLGLESLTRQSFDLGDVAGREIGYVLSKDYWGQGLMPEACKAVIQYCFEKENYDFLLCGHFDWNKQSQRVVEKSGFTYLKDIEFNTIMGHSEKGKIYVLRRNDYESNTNIK